MLLGLRPALLESMNQLFLPSLSSKNFVLGMVQKPGKTAVRNTRREGMDPNPNKPKPRPHPLSISDQIGRILEWHPLNYAADVHHFASGRRRSRAGHRHRHRLPEENRPRTPAAHGLSRHPRRCRCKLHPRLGFHPPPNHRRSLWRLDPPHQRRLRPWHGRLDEPQRQRHER